MRRTFRALSLLLAILLGLAAVSTAAPDSLTLVGQGHNCICFDDAMCGNCPDGSARYCIFYGGSGCGICSSC